jgi:hypothetical protein
MPTIPASFAELLAGFRRYFTVSTFTTFTTLACGFLAQPGPGTVTGMLVGARLSHRWHHARGHRFFATARWSVDQLGLVLLDLIVRLLLAPDAPLPLAVDDSLFRRTGRKVFGTAWHHDADAPGRGRVAWGNSWVVVGVLVTLPFVPHRGSASRSCAACGNPSSAPSRRSRRRPGSPSRQPPPRASAPMPGSSSNRSPAGTRIGRSTWSAMPPTSAGPGAARPSG